MKKSIGRHFFIAITGLLAGTILICILINNVFLESYYRKDSARKVTQVYEALREVASAQMLEDDASLENVMNYALTYNLNILIINADSEAVMIMSYNNGEELTRKLIGYILGMGISGMPQNPDGITVPEMNQVFHYQDMRTGIEYMEMYGNLDNNYWFLISTPMESIHTSVSLSNRFLTYVGIIAVLLGAVISWLLSKRLTKPILELSRLSERIRNLDFEAKYTGKADNEIGVLGNNMNQLSESLERTISELKTANNELKSDIEKKEQIEQMRTEFLSNVSHELKTPIALIQGYAEGLSDGIIRDEESRAYYLEVIQDEAEKMNVMVQKLLSLNQLEFGNEVVNMERFDIAELIREYVAGSRILTQEQGITVLLPEAESVFVWGDRFRVEEVLMNYFTNAIHFCRGEKKIVLSLESRDNRIRIGVFNSGDPIPEESLPHLWEKFYKVDKARTREYGGSGIGLSIVKALMESMHQEYGVRNFNNGVEFYFTLDAVG